MSDILGKPDAFAKFYDAVHGYDSKHEYKPFTWQSRLAKYVLDPKNHDEHGAWPALLDLPTSSGKTSALDVAVFHLAYEAARMAAEGRSSTPRRAPLRIFFVVDRRIVVDDAYKHARAIADLLADPDRARPEKRAILRAVAEPLRRLADIGVAPCGPLAVARLRGGAPKEQDWVRSPSQPTIILSTVDQVGSRLLFRGYGVTDRMKSIQAGLVGSDALIFLDEAHLSNPFVETLDSIERIMRERRRSAKDAEPQGPSRPFQVVTLSATPRAESASSTKRFALAAEDLKDSNDSAVLMPRLTCSKPARLVLVDEAAEVADSSNDPVTKKLVETAKTYLEDSDVIAVVVNRVRRARAVFERLREMLGGEDEGPEKGTKDEHSADVILLTGRTRPLDRDAILGEYVPRMEAKRKADEKSRKLIVVATQCVEAGADFDFDALVTEISALDSLRQRFGRLNRMGRRNVAPATIVASSRQVGAKAKPDFVYGEALRATWELLSKAPSRAAPKRKGGNEADKRKAKPNADGAVDFGVFPSRAWLPPVLEPYLTPVRHAPELVPSFVRQWACTSPVPTLEPEVSLFLHGPEAGPADVQIVWRADLKEGDRGAAADKDQFDREQLAEWRDRVATCPPSSLEALPVPFHEARRWLSGEEPGDIADIEGVGEGAPPRRVRFRALRWRGPDDAKFVILDDRERREMSFHAPLVPGDMIIVPSSKGGCDAWGWNPREAKPKWVRDWGALANRLHRRRDILRLSSDLFMMDRAAEQNVTDWTKVREERRTFERIIPTSPTSPTGPTSRTRESGDDVEREEFSSADLARRLLDFEALPQSWRDRLKLAPKAFRAIRDREGTILALERRLSPVDVQNAIHEGKVSHRESAEGDIAGPAFTEDDDGSAYAPEQPPPDERTTRDGILLSAHSKGVRDLARIMAEHAGIDVEHAADVALAAFLHDAGKAHPDFQSLLFGGDEIAALQAKTLGKPLAKGRRLRLGEGARRRAHLPLGARHEVASLSFALAHPALRSARDPDLVLWLIGTHHGYGRPFFPAVVWPLPNSTFHLDLGDQHALESKPAMSLAELTARWCDLHRELTQRYGAWELAHYEAIVRLADHRCSELEQREPATPEPARKKPRTERSPRARVHVHVHVSEPADEVLP